MVNIQESIFRWASQQPASIGLLLLGLGVVYGMFGYKIFPGLLGLTMAAVGAAVGAIAAAAGDLDLMVGLTGGAVVGGVLGAKMPRVCAPFGGFVVGALTGWIVAERFGLDLLWLLTSGALMGAFFLTMTLLCYRTMTVVLTTIQGAGLLLVGLVAFTCVYVPDFGHTFRVFAANSSLLTPVVLAMLAATGYSYQEMQRRGDIIAGV